MESRAIIISQCVGKNEKKMTFRFKGAFCGEWVESIELKNANADIELSESYVMEVINIEIIDQIMRAELKKAKKIEDHYLL